MIKLCLAILLCSYLIASIQCINFENILSQYQNALNKTSNSVREKRSSANYWPYDLWYYHYWNYYNYYPAVFVVSTCGHYTCPSQCPGVCGTYSGYSACKCNKCLTVPDPCSYYNIARGAYLHPFPYDATRYIQCDSTPGTFYIRNCPSGLVFDARYSVCNYAYPVYHGK